MFRPLGPITRMVRRGTLPEAFGADLAKAGDKATLSNFRAKCLRELKKIKMAWPDLHYSTPKGVLLLLPSPPRISPSQLSLVE